MTLDVWRRYEPSIAHKRHEIGWEVEPVDLLVWRRHDDGRIFFNLDPVPEGYAPGLFRCYINGARCSLAEFDEALAKVGVTREGIVAVLT